MNIFQENLSPIMNDETEEKQRSIQQTSKQMISLLPQLDYNYRNP